MDVDATALLTIVGMALVTYATRAGGLWLMSRLSLSPFLTAWLEAVPGAVLVAIVAPALARGGAPEVLATVAAVLVARRTGNLLLAMAAGIGAVWLVRLLLPAA